MGAVALALLAAELDVVALDVDVAGCGGSVYLDIFSRVRVVRRVRLVWTMCLILYRAALRLIRYVLICVLGMLVLCGRLIILKFLRLIRVRRCMVRLMRLIVRRVLRVFRWGRWTVLVRRRVLPKTNRLMRVLIL